MVKVSVILPVYNVAPYLKECLDSLVGQTLRDLEIVAVDDGSTDGSSAILDEYAACDPRVRVVHQTNSGAGAARNVGMDLAAGEYLYFCDPDDFCDLRMLEQMTRRADETQADIVACGRVSIESATNKVAYERAFPEWHTSRPIITPAEIADFLYILDPHVPWDKVFRHSFIRARLLHFQNLPCSNDIYFVDMALALASGLTFMPQLFYHHRLRRSGSLQTTKDRSATALYTAYDALWEGLEREGVASTFAMGYLRGLVNSGCVHLRGLQNPENRQWSLKLLEERVRKFLPHLPSFPGTEEGRKWATLERATVDFIDVEKDGLWIRGHREIPECVVPVEFAEWHDFDALGRLQVDHVAGRPWSMVVHGLFSPMTEILQKCFYVRAGKVLRLDGRTLTVKPATASAVLRARTGQMLALLRFKKRLAFKVLAASALARLGRLLLFGRRIWLFSDRVSRADDNGRALFDFAVSQKWSWRRPIFIFAIDGASLDAAELRRHGLVVDIRGKWYKLVFLLSNCVISAYHTRIQRLPFSDVFVACARQLVLRPEFVYLRHGVGEKDLSRVCNRRVNNARLMMTTARGEYDSVIGEKTGYSSREVRLCGLPRYDRLYDDPKKIITVMPTWRGGLIKWDEFGDHRPSDVARESAFVREYHALLNNRELLHLCETTGYVLQLMMHPNCLSILPLLRVVSQVRILPPTESYRKVFAESALLITDYSSTAFDFAYLNKPVVYFQFDRDEYFGTFYRPGFFDYRRDGFGPVETTVDGVIKQISDYVSRGCGMRDEDRRNAERFFAHRDRRNCARVYTEIEQLRG